MYSRMHLTNWIERLAAWSENIKDEHCVQHLVKSGKNAGKTFRICKRYISRCGTYRPYTAREIEILKPQWKEDELKPNLTIEIPNPSPVYTVDSPGPTYIFQSQTPEAEEKEYECACGASVNGLDIRLCAGQCRDCYTDQRQCDSCDFFASDPYDLYGHEYDVQKCSKCMQEYREKPKLTIEIPNPSPYTVDSPAYNPTSPTYLSIKRSINMEEPPLKKRCL